MNKNKRFILIVALGLMASTAGGLTWLRTHQQLGRPGILTSPITDSPRLNIHLPEFVLDYKSEVIEPDPGLFTYMPKDSSFGQRRYVATDGFTTLLNAVLMGTDRSTIHKPQFCLTGIGWKIDDSKSVETTVPMQNPHPYDLPVMKLLATRNFDIKGRTVTARGIYVYWFVADHELTASHWTRMWRMGKELLSTGRLQRWAYITCFSVCEPGQEDATYARMQKFMQASIPQFQLATGPRSAGVTAAQTASK
ncbi:MAG: eight transrane protein EpsH [Pedosphaera sp.]|jgi:hypothetical protein|nr:eight transrane protein EpsH [Pedosphaera sp.]